MDRHQATLTKRHTMKRRNAKLLLAKAEKTVGKIIAKTIPFSANALTKTVVVNDARPILTSIFPKTIVESKKLGFFNKYFNFFAFLNFACIFLKRVVLKEKIAVSEAEKKAENKTKITMRMLLRIIIYSKGKH